MKRLRMQVLVIDFQSYWREYVAQTLQDADYQVLEIATYREVLQRSRDGESWDLVLLGCSSIEQEERLLVAHLIARRQPVIVLSTALSLQDMRGLFLQGAIDVTDKTYHPVEILAIVEKAQEKLISKERPWALTGEGAFQ